MEYCHPQHLDIVAIEKGAFGSPSFIFPVFVLFLKKFSPRVMYQITQTNTNHLVIYSTYTRDPNKCYLSGAFPSDDF